MNRKPYTDRDNYYYKAPGNWCLAHRTEPGLFVRFTKSSTGRKSGRTQWELTDNVDTAETFATADEAHEERQRRKIPAWIAPRSYESCREDARRKLYATKQQQPTSDR